jgi:hypothetical protein
MAYKTLSISPRAHQLLGVLSVRSGLSKLAYIEAALEYFSETGVDPRQHIKLTPAGQIKTIGDRLFGMLKTQEKLFLKPLNTRLAEIESLLADAFELERERRDRTSFLILERAKVDFFEQEIRRFIVVQLRHRENKLKAEGKAVNPNQREEANKIVAQLFPAFKDVIVF